MTIKTILQGKGSKVFSMAPDATLDAVSKELAERRIGAVVVMDGERLVGILSERDIIRCIAERGTEALTEPAHAAMTRKVETAGLNDDISDVMQRMTASRFRHMPVVEEGRLIGLISIGDVVKQRIDEAERERDDMRAYILNG